MIFIETHQTKPMRKMMMTVVDRDDADDVHLVKGHRRRTVEFLFHERNELANSHNQRNGRGRVTLQFSYISAV